MKPRHGHPLRRGPGDARRHRVADRHGGDGGGRTGRRRAGFLTSTTANRLHSARWERAVAPNWLAAATVGWNGYARRTGAGVLDVEVRDRRVSWRADVSGGAGRWLLRAGADGGLTRTTAAGFVPTRGRDFTGVGGVSDFDVALDDRRVGAYAEIEGGAGAVVPNLGVRLDRFALAAETTADPRLSLLVPAGGAQRVRVAWGLYHQAPPPLYYDRHRGAARLPPMRAAHWVVGYEYGADDDSFAVRRPRGAGLEPVFGPINSQRAPRYERLDLSVDVVTEVGRAPVVLFGGVTNVLDRYNVLAYAWSPDYRERRPVTSATPRAIYAGFSVGL